MSPSWSTAPLVVRIMANCVFQIIGSFSFRLSYCGHRIFHNIPLLSFYVYGISGYGISFIFDSSNLGLLSLYIFFCLFCGSLPRGLSIIIY